MNAPDDPVGLQLIAELAAELWVVKRRQTLLEQRLIQLGIDADLGGPAAASTPDEVQARDEFVARIFGPMEAPASTPER